METSSESTPFSTSRLLASVRSRARQSIAGVLVLAALCVGLVLLLDISVPRELLALWLGGVLVTALVRWQIARRANVALVHDDVVAARRFDRAFLLASMAAQSIGGAGVWLAWAADDPVAAYVLTLLTVFYCVGAAANLAHDLRAFVLSAPLLMVQPVVYWLLTGWSGVPIALGCAGMLALLVASVRTSQALFDEGLQIRFEKDRLHAEVADRNTRLAATLEELGRANRAKSFFMATASHDLRQPVIAAALVGESLRRMPLPADALARLAEQGAMLRETQTMMRNLLDVARFEEGVVTASFAPVPLDQVFEYLRLTFADTRIQGDVELHVEQTPLWVRSDRELLQRLLGNLVSNALKYTDKGAVSVRAEAHGAAVRLIVSDTGCGIAEADAQRMFEPFVRLSAARGRSTTGAGLGLAIVRGIAGLLDARLNVASVLGAGTHVTVTLDNALLDRRDADAPTATEQLGLGDALAGQVVWLIGLDNDSVRLLDPELSQLGCVCGMAARLEECDALIADGEYPDALVIGAGGAEADSVAAIVEWCRMWVPKARVLRLAEESAGTPVDHSATVCIAPTDRIALVRWLAGERQHAAA